MVALTNVNAYLFWLSFSDLTCHLVDTVIGLFELHCTALVLIVKRPDLDLAIKRLFHQLVSCRTWKVV